MKYVLLSIFLCFTFRIQGQENTQTICKERNILYDLAALRKKISQGKPLPRPSVYDSCDYIVKLSKEGFLLTGFEKYGYTINMYKTAQMPGVLTSASIEGYFDLKNDTDSIITIRGTGFSSNIMWIRKAETIELPISLSPKESVKLKYTILGGLTRFRGPPHWASNFFAPLFEIEDTKISDIRKYVEECLGLEDRIRYDDRKLYWYVPNTLSVYTILSNGTRSRTTLRISFSIPAEYLKEIVFK